MLKLLYRIINAFRNRIGQATIENQIPGLPSAVKKEKGPALDIEQEEENIKKDTELHGTLQSSYNWAVERINNLDEAKGRWNGNARAIESEFGEWLDPDIPEHDVFSLEYIGKEYSEDDQEARPSE